MEMDDEPVEAVIEAESGHTTGRMSARSQRIEVIMRGERRRRWSVEQKREIAAESLEPGISPITVARRYGISSGLLYTWRRHLLEGSLGTASRPVAKFARVEVMAMPADPAPAAPPAVHPAGGQRRASSGARCAGAAMIALQSDVRVYLACGYTDMRKGMQGLAMLVQQMLAEDPFNGALYAFRGRRGNLLKLVWHDGIGLCMLTKRLERGHFIWPMTGTGSIALSAGQLSTLLEGCEWRAMARNLRPELAG